MSLTRLTHSRDAWRLLNGLVCLYKPAGYPGVSLTNMLKHRLVDDLNSMERSVEREDRRLELEGGGGEVVVSDVSGGDVVAGGQGLDYSVHPLVLGPGYTAEDIQVNTVNKLANDVSGVLLVGLNEGGRQARGLKSGKVLNTFHVHGEWGRATSSGWVGGKTRYCHTWRHLAGRPWLVDQCLASVQAAHQARAWNVANIGLDTQEAYEQALKGPVKPAMLSETLVYSIKVMEWKLPNFMLEVQCVEGMDNKQEYLVRLVEEIGLKVKTVAHTSSLRCAAVGPFTSTESLLPKHINLQHVLDNISDNRKLFNKTWPTGWVGSDQGFKRQKRRRDEEESEGKREKQFTEFLEE
eukprot:TRINITY_DN15907_c0_g1_i1.p1 TRINITY_DN15907_c0_g1~~TRINITY_DN15907_c0_g1_i1.p1  ORF type:complete len:351 (-),score=129.59 TRINITY_DN15907_c0_g1_i1:41-1093(-)